MRKFSLSFEHYYKYRRKIIEDKRKALDVMRAFAGLLYTVIDKQKKGAKDYE